MIALKNKRIWIYGGAGYLGQAVVKEFLKSGAEVMCVDREDRAENFCKELENSEAVISESCDIGDVSRTEELTRKWLKSYGVPDGVANLAFQASGAHLEDLTIEAFDKANHVNLTSTFSLSRQIAEAMAENGQGSIVTFSSMYGLVSPDPSIYEAPMAPNPIEYGVGKAGIIQMTRYLAAHYGRRGVRFNAIAPGPFPNPSVQEENPSLVKELSKRTMLGRIGRAEEIGPVVAFLLSEAASYITGQTLSVDGGWTSW